MGRTLNAILVAFTLLGVGYFFTKKIALLRKFSIPPSLSVSILVLILFTIVPSYQQTVVYKDWKEWPGLIIAFIFASLFLEKQEEAADGGAVSNGKEVLGQISIVFIAILGQMVIGILLSAILFKPVFDLPLAFASVLENGFAGGHGTAVAMKQSYADNGLPTGVDYALFSATIGIILGIAGGVFLVAGEKSLRGPVEEKEQQLTLSLSSLFLSLGLIFISVYVAIQIKGYAEYLLPKFPQITLFVYALLVSVIIKRIVIILGYSNILSGQEFSFFSSFFMELLIFSAIVTMDLSVISDALLPLSILFSAGFIWNLFVHFKLKDKFLPKEYATELSLVNFGMLNGTTAIGLMLLRMIDPELKSKGVKIYAEAAPFTSPIVGGGLLTLALPYLINQYNPFLVAGIISMAMLTFYLMGKIKE
jgi:glutamate:Na+ symporter, ESS family